MSLSVARACIRSDASLLSTKQDIIFIEGNDENDKSSYMAI